MPTKNPRLTITMQPALAAQLRRLSELTGNSQGALIADLLEGSGPVFDRLIRVLEAAQSVSASMKGSIAGDLDAAQTKLEEQLGLSLAVIDDATQPLLDEAERVHRRSRKAARARALPASAALVSPVVTPPSNRGVRSTRKQAGNRGQRYGPV